MTQDPRIPGRDASATIEFIDKDYRVVHTVRFGLFDAAYHDIRPRENISPLNHTDETWNYVGFDSRRWFVRITAPGLSGVPWIKARWATFFDEGGNQEIPHPGDTTIDLMEQPAGSGIFVSAWLMLVTADWEVKAGESWSHKTTRGLPASHEQVPSQASNDPTLIDSSQPGFRLRKASMWGSTGIEFPIGSGQSARARVFEPHERKTCRIQFYVMDRPGARWQPWRGLPGSAETVARWLIESDMDNIRNVYSRIGIWVKTAPEHGLRPIAFGDEYVHIVEAPPVCRDINCVIERNLGDLRDTHAGVDPDVIRIFVVPALDGVNGWGSGAGACVIRASMDSTSPAAHEMGHVMGLDHWTEASPVNRLHQEVNLMCEGATASPYFNTAIARCSLWDYPDGRGHNQYHVLRNSRFATG